MIDRVLDFLTGKAAPTTAKGEHDFELAVAALLIEAERMADCFDSAERAMIEHVLAAKFSMDHVEVQELIAAAEKAVRNATQLFPFTQKIVKTMPPEDRHHILELMWKVAYADGTLDPHEDMLLRRIAGLLHVPDRERGLARQSALDKLKKLTQ
ncbi:MAG: TerB family tellurite resistance protein [Alphaproteobacteria bacterium]|nr:TerB family tellurite resistance protein [Alphaproteobacteria bacterium]